MLTCGWVEHDEPCGESDEVYMNLALCPIHKEEHRGKVNFLKGSTARQAAKSHPLEAFPGWCYFVLLPDGSVKIGYSNTEKLLKTRFTVLNREVGPIVKLAVIPGGFVAEAVMHERFKESRLPGKGERFRYTPEMAEFLASVSQ